MPGPGQPFPSLLAGTVLGVVSAGTRTSDQIAGPGWLAIGDAALARDPLSGEGITAALRTAVAAERAYFAWASGEVEALARYDEAGGRVREQYLDARMDAYGSQGRYGHLRFWSRRSRPNCQGNAPS